MAFLIFIFVKVQFEANGLEIIYALILFNAFVRGFLKYCIALGGGGMGWKKRTVLTYETTLHGQKFAEFQRQAMVKCPAFLG